MGSWIGYWPQLHSLQFVVIENLPTLPYGLPHGSHGLVGLSQGLGQVGWSKLPNLLLASHNVGKRVPFLSHSPKRLFFWWAKNWTFLGNSLFCIFWLKYAFVDSKTFILLTKFSKWSWISIIEVRMATRGALNYHKLIRKTNELDKFE